MDLVIQHFIVRDGVFISFLCDVIFKMETASPAVNKVSPALQESGLMRRTYRIRIRMNYCVAVKVREGG